MCGCGDIWKQMVGVVICGERGCEWERCEERGHEW